MKVYVGGGETIENDKIRYFNIYMLDWVFRLLERTLVEVL